MVPLPTYQCRDAVDAAAVKAAVQGISACATEGSNIAVTNLGACSSANSWYLAFINQIKVAFCYILGIQSDHQTQINTITTDITAIEAQLPPSHPVGTPTLVGGAAAGASPTLTLLAGSTDTDGAIALITGTGTTAAGGLMIQLVFASSFTNEVRVLLTVGGVSRAFSIQHTPVLTGPVSSVAIYIFDTTAAIADATQFRVSYSVREL